MKLRRHRAELVARMQILLRIAQALLVLIAIGYWGVQVADGAYYRELADNNRLRKQSIEASRGLILDRNGQPLVENIPNYTLLVDRSRLEDPEATLSFVAPILEEDVSELRLRLEQARGPKFRPALLAEGLTLAQLSQIEVHNLEHPELEVGVSQLRLYRYAHQTAHLLGYQGEVSDQEMAGPDSIYRAGELVGRKGIERQYEHLLRGQSGERVVVVDSRGRTIGDFDDNDDQVAAVSGRDVRLGLDLQLQQEAARLLEGKVGSIVAMDPNTGEILAMVSSPSFDPNLFARRLDADEWRQLIENRHHPLQNRALQNTYPPGSAFKIIMAVAALEERVIDPNKKVFCRGFSVIHGHRYRCWNSAGHGWVDLHDAIKHSCNVYFHQIGQRLDIDTIAEYTRRFGMGRRTGIDLGGEKKGLVPDEAWSREARGTPWYSGETISVSIGQGPLLATPLQMAVMMSAIANSGRVPRPHLRIDGQPQIDLQEENRIEISARTLERVQAALWAVVNEQGTGKSAFLDRFAIAGKTGTAQVVRQETWTTNEELAAEQRDHAWFVSYGPFEDPALTVVVFVEHGGGGSTAAAPLAKAIYEKFLDTDLAHHHPG